MHFLKYFPYSENIPLKIIYKKKNISHDNSEIFKPRVVQENF